MNSFLDWLDEAAGAFIRLAYLIAGITAVAVYFGAGAMPPIADHLLNAALPWVLAAAVETHTYLTSRRVRAAWQERDHGALAVNIAILAVLLAFSAWNQLGYLSGSWTPPHNGPLALPTWAAYGVRALIVPVAFMAAAFLAPLAAPITAQIEQEAQRVLRQVFKIARKQRKRMLKEAQRSGRDLTGALVELVGNPDTRRIIAHAYGAIRPADAGGWLAVSAGDLEGYSAEAAMAAVARELHIIYPPQIEASTDDGDSGETPPEPPAGGGRPTTASLASMRGADATPGAANVTPLRRSSPRGPSGPSRAPRRSRRDASRANARSGRRGAAEQRVRALLAQTPLMSHAEMVRRTKLSPSTVSKWLRVIEAERITERGAEQANAGRAG